MPEIKEIVSEILQGFRPPAKLKLSEWADKYAVLSAESSAEAGRWKTIPYQRGIMDAFTDPMITMITVMKSARVGYTKILNHAIGYHIHQDPCSIMLVQPTIEDAEGYSKEEIAPMLRDTPCLQGLVTDAKAKDGSNTTLTKIYPGGTLGLVGANSPRGFRRVSRRIVLFDEVDGYPMSAGSEGDQIKLGIKRSEYFWNRKIVLGSTPTVKELSRIERHYEASDQRRYFVPCPQCDHPQYLKWANLKWDENQPETAHFVCEKNGCVIEHSSKRWMIEEADRRQMADPSSPYGWQPTAPGNNSVGFHIWAAYSYSPNASWGQLAKEFLESKSDPEALKTFINTALGETWEENYRAKVGAETLQSRVEFYEPGQAPEGTIIVTAGVDVQDNRFAITLWGWGRNEESWVISHEEIFGDPSKPEIWKQLDNVLFNQIRHANGGMIPVSVAGIDTGGHYTHETYQYVRSCMTKSKTTLVLALKGQSQKNKPAIGKPTKVDINFRGQILKASLELFPVGTDTVKALIYGRLKLNEVGPGYVHFHAKLPTDYFTQLTVEKQTVRYVKGFVMTEWQKPANARNEAFDTAVYGYVALQYLYTRYHRATIWDQFERKLAVSKPETAGINKEQATPLQNQATARTMKPNRKKGFVSSW